MEARPTGKRQTFAISSPYDSARFSRSFASRATHNASRKQKASSKCPCSAFCRHVASPFPNSGACIHSLASDLEPYALACPRVPFTFAFTTIPPAFRVLFSPLGPPFSLSIVFRPILIPMRFLGDGFVCSRSDIFDAVLHT